MIDYLIVKESFESSKALVKALVTSLNIRTFSIVLIGCGSAYLTVIHPVCGV